MLTTALPCNRAHGAIRHTARDCQVSFSPQVISEAVSHATAYTRVWCAPLLLHTGACIHK